MKIIPLLFAFLLIAETGFSQAKQVTSRGKQSWKWKGKLAHQLGLMHLYEITKDPSIERKGESLNIPGFITVITPTLSGNSVYTAEMYYDSTEAAIAMKAMAAELKEQRTYKVYDSNNPAHVAHFTNEYGLKDSDIRIIRLVDKRKNNIAFITQRNDGIYIVFE